MESEHALLMNILYHGKNSDIFVMCYAELFIVYLFNFNYTVKPRYNEHAYSEFWI